MYLLDTNICVYILNKKPESVRAKLDRLSIDEVFVSSISVYELDAGARKGSRAADNLLRLERFLLMVKCLPFEEAAARRAGKLEQYLRDQGNPISTMDVLIAAHGLHLDATVVTHNTREFARVPGLRLEDWAA